MLKDSYNEDMEWMIWSSVICNLIKKKKKEHFETDTQWLPWDEEEIMEF